MLNTQNHDPRDTAPMPLLTAADLQDNLITAAHDLDRLQTLLAHACDSLIEGFQGASQCICEYTAAPNPDAHTPEVLRDVMEQLSVAITALQFQDMASQLISHTRKRLRNCADRIANDTMGSDDEGLPVIEEAPLRPNPVAQIEMQSGSVELF